MAVAPRESLRFLDLPAEVRLTVYGYLVPNLPVRNFPLIRRQSKKFRDDGTRCCPAILRVNHQIYNEVILEWYGSASYEVVLDSKYIMFCGRIIPPFVPVPSTMQLVHSMQLCTSIQGSPQHVHSLSTMELLQGFQDRLVVLARMLADRHATRLKHLHVEVGVNIPLLLSLCKTPTGMLGLLGFNLGPLRTHVRCLESMDWDLKEESYGIESQEFQQSYAELRSIMCGYLNGMRQDMVSDLEDT